MTIDVNGDTMTVTAGDLAQGLIDATVGTSNSSGRAGTLGTLNGRSNATMTVKIGAVTSDRAGGTTNIARDLGRTFIHEAGHMVPQESAFQTQFNNSASQFNSDHQTPYNSMSVVFDRVWNP